MFSKIKLFDKNGSKNTTHYYLSVVISLAAVETAVWEMITDHGGGGYNILGFGHRDLTSQDEIEKKVTEAIDEAGKSAGVDFEDAVFGLPSSWVEKEDIVEPHDQLIDKICKDLEIEPIAFVPVDTAVAYFLASKLGGPITANLIEIGHNKVSVSVINSGSIKYSQDLKKTTDIPQSVFNLFSNSKSDNLPARFIIFGATSQDELAEIENEFNNFNWLQKDGDYSAFLHIPKVTAVTDFSLAEAVAMSTSSDFSAQDEFMQASEKAEKNEEQGDVVETKALPEEPQIVTPFPEEEVEENSFGFVQNEDAALIEPGEPTSISTDHEITAEPESQFPAKNTTITAVDFPSTDYKPPAKAKHKPKVSLNIFAPLLGIKVIRKHKTVFYSVIASLGLITIFVLYLVIPRAEINIKVKTQDFDQRFIITASTAATVLDVETRTIPARSVTIEESGNEKSVATGTKTVGERAKGSVTVYNKTDSLRTIPKGSVMTTGGLSFTLDNDVSVASQSAGIEGSTYGKADAPVTASSVGTDSNIAADKELKFSNFDINIVSARSKSAFTGGSSRQVTVFSEDDAKRIKSLLSDKLLDSAVARIQKENPSTQILKSAVSAKILSEKYDVAVGDETVSANYDQKSSFTSIIYSAEDINNISYDLILKSVPQGYMVRKEDIKIDPAVKNSSGGKLEIELNISTKVFAQVDTASIVQKIKGKNHQAVDEYLKSFPNVTGYEFNLIPPLPEFIKTVPANVKQITITIIPE